MKTCVIDEETKLNMLFIATLPVKTVLTTMMRNIEQDHANMGEHKQLKTLEENLR